MKEIVSRGHDVGLHASYDAFACSKRLANELKVLAKATQSVGLVRQDWSCRNHYLRLSVPNTWKAQAEARITADWTLGYAETPGFRAGTACAFQAFDVVEGKRINVMVHPLVLMDISLMSSHYARSSAEQIVERVRSLWIRIKRHGGEFVLLWHNSSLVTRSEHAICDSVLDVLSDSVKGNGNSGGRNTCLHTSKLT